MIESPLESRRFWEQPDLVDRFAARDPDVRLVALLDRFPEPPVVRVLDLGCAGGRNTVLLAERGFDIHSLDASEAMVERTRARVAEILGAEDAVGRVALGVMEDLGRYADDTFEVVVGLGIYHQAQSGRQWDRAIAETARVLKRGGLLLYASFSPESAPDGVPATLVPGEPHVFSGFRAGRVYLLNADTLDVALAEQGLCPAEQTVTVRVDTEKGRRVTVNGLYRRV